MIKKVCVFCGSSTGKKPEFVQAARQLGTVLAQRDLVLVYGAGCTGLMGETADAVLSAGGKVIGITPDMFMNRGLIHEHLSEMIVVQSMHERKLAMNNLADAFIALPGGYGTMDELFETVAWGQLGLHQKPCGILNVCGYYDRLIEFLDEMAASQFIKADHRSMLLAEEDPAALLDKMAAYDHPDTPKVPIG